MSNLIHAYPDNYKEHYKADTNIHKYVLCTFFTQIRALISQSRAKQHCTYKQGSGDNFFLHLVKNAVATQTAKIITVVIITKGKLTDATKLMSVYVAFVVSKVIKLLKQKPVHSAAKI